MSRRQRRSSLAALMLGWAALAVEDAERAETSVARGSRMIRSADWGNPPSAPCSASRAARYLNSRYDMMGIFGFRVARTLK